jgi:hypothetical protein
LPGARRPEQQHVFALANKTRGREIVDESAVHLLSEIEIKSIEDAVCIAESGQLDAAGKEAVAPPSSAACATDGPRRRSGVARAPASGARAAAADSSGRGAAPARLPIAPAAAADPAWRSAVVGGVDLDAGVEMHRALAVLVITKWLDRQLAQMRFLFGKHRRHLALGRAVDARVGPVRLPAIEVELRLFDALKTLALQRRLRRMAYARLDLALCGQASSL